MDAKEFREVGHRVVDLLAEYLGDIEEKRVFPDVEPRKTNELFAQPLPQDPSPTESVLQELEAKLFPYCTNVGHPGYMGLITPSPNPVGIIADFICSYTGSPEELDRELGQHLASYVDSHLALGSTLAEARAQMDAAAKAARQKAKTAQQTSKPDTGTRKEENATPVVAPPEATPSLFPADKSGTETNAPEERTTS